jgi:hypothetical protein
MDFETAYKLRRLFEQTEDDRPDSTDHSWSHIPAKLLSWDVDPYEPTIRVRIEIEGVGEFGLVPWL